MSAWLLALMLLRQAPDCTFSPRWPDTIVMKCGPEPAAQWNPSPGDDRTLASWVEQHCVAVLVEGHDEKHHMEITHGYNLPYYEQSGDWIEHVPEQTLKLRCKP